MRSSTIPVSVILCSEIDRGEVEAVLAGGTESMTQAPYAVRNARFGIKLVSVARQSRGVF